MKPHQRQALIGGAFLLVTVAAGALIVGSPPPAAEAAAYRVFGAAAGTTIDGTGLASTAPLTIKNGKASSGLELQVTGTAPTGIVFRDSSAVRKAAIGYAVAGGDWATGSTAGELVINPVSALFVRPDTGGAIKLYSANGNGVVQLDDTTGWSMTYATRNITLNSLNAFITTRWGESKGATVASATNVTLGNDGNYFEISGTTTINCIVNTGWRSGARITLYFQSALTLTDGAACAGANEELRLQGNANVAISALSTVDFRYDLVAGDWLQITAPVVH